MNKWVKPILIILLVIILALLPLKFTSPYLLHVLILTFIYKVAAVSLRTITISGQFSIAHGAFMGVGAYVAALTVRYFGWSPWATMLLGAVAAGLIGLLFGYPFSRLRTLYFAMGSLFFGVAVIYIIQATRITGGYLGLQVPGSLFGFGNKIPYYYFFLGLSLICIVALYRFEFSRIGISMKAVAQSHLLASSVGINESWYRILAIGVGCFFVGLIGAAFVLYNGIATPASFNMGITLWITMYVLIGGIGSFAGPIIGTPILYFIPQYYLTDLRAYSPYIPAVILIIIAYLMPKGLAGLIFVLKDRLMEKISAGKTRKETVDVAGD